MTDTANPQPDKPDQSATPLRKKAKPFNDRQFQWQVWMDRASMWVFFILVVLLIFAPSLTPELESRGLWSILFVAVIASWIFLNTSQARIAQHLPVIDHLILTDSQAAEDLLAHAQQGKPMKRVLRLMLYYHLAVFRHQQQQFAESAQICAAVIGVIEQSGPRLFRGKSNTYNHTLVQLSLMSGESRLTLGDVTGAYLDLIRAHSLPRTLQQTAQLAGLQTQYEIICGYHGRALDRVEQRIQLAELMPAAQCGAMHWMLGVAADHEQRSDLARWCRHRAELFCTPQEIEHFKSKMLNFAVLDPSPLSA